MKKAVLLWFILLASIFTCHSIPRYVWKKAYNLLDIGNYKEGIDYAYTYKQRHPDDIEAELLLQMFYAYGMHNNFDFSITAQCLLQLDSTSFVSSTSDITPSGNTFLTDYIEICEILGRWDNIITECPKFLIQYTLQQEEITEILHILSEAYEHKGMLIDAYECRRKAFDIDLYFRQIEIQNPFSLSLDTSLEWDVKILLRIAEQLQIENGLYDYKNDADSCSKRAQDFMHQSPASLPQEKYQAKNYILPRKESDKNYHISYVQAPLTWWVDFYKEQITKDSIAIVSTGFWHTDNYFDNLFTLSALYADCQEYELADSCFDVIEQQNLSLFPFAGDRFLYNVRLSHARGWIDMQRRYPIRHQGENIDSVLLNTFGLDRNNLIPFIAEGKYLLSGYYNIVSPEGFPLIMNNYYSYLATKHLYQREFPLAVQYANLSDSIAKAFLHFGENTYLQRELYYGTTNQFIRANGLEHYGTKMQIYLAFQNLYDRLISKYENIYIKPHRRFEGDWGNVFPMEVYTEENRKDFPFLFKKELYCINHIASYRNDSILNKLAYDQSLFTKSLLLNTYKLLFENDIVRTSQEYTTLVRLQQEQKQMPHSFKYDSLQNLINQLEADIVFHYMDSANIEQNIRLTTDKIVENMHKGDVAIEFVECFPNFNEDSMYYTAMVLSPMSRYPKIITLCSEEELSLTSKGNSSISYKELSNLIWRRLLPCAQEANTIYFAPAGFLHQIPLESLPFDSVSTMSDHFNMVRLSSTREIVLRNNREHKESATIYGGIQYDVDTTELLAESRLYEQTQLLASRGMENDTIDRGSVKYLWGTKKEAESIDRLLAKHNVSATLYTSTAANEESFKALSGKHQNIIHIGTHGFYWADSTARKQDFFMQRSMSMGDDLPMQYAIDPLDRCGLLFAGANMALSGHSRDLPEGVQDGILTAKEISLMDLRDCDLVVLSACETAKGDITSEGVFGLQRAFKMAGVQTIIMSLWKVDDNATQMLMTEFYTNWIEKKQSKREAFKNAQNAVRFAVDKYGDRMYADPVYWAGFIMLD